MSSWHLNPPHPVRAGDLRPHPNTFQIHAYLRTPKVPKRKSRDVSPKKMGPSNSSYIIHNQIFPQKKQPFWRCPIYGNPHICVFLSHLRRGISAALVATARWSCESRGCPLQWQKMIENVHQWDEFGHFLSDTILMDTSLPLGKKMIASLPAQSGRMNLDRSPPLQTLPTAQIIWWRGSDGPGFKRMWR